MTYATIEVSGSNGVSRVSLNRPDVHNAFNAQAITELTDVFRALSRSDNRVIVLSGNGRSFCAGADVAWMRESLDLAEKENLEDARRMSDMFAAIDEAPQAVVARVHGAALGGGMGLLAVCDVVIAARECRFGFTETKLGIIPAVISRFVVPKIGPSWARRLFLTGERFGSDRAREIGLVHDVMEAADLDAAVDAVIGELLSAGPQAVREAKGLVAGVIARPAEQRRDYTAGRIAAVRTSAEGQEGLRAFLERRQPAWKRDPSGD